MFGPGMYYVTCGATTEANGAAPYIRGMFLRMRNISLAVWGAAAAKDIITSGNPGKAEDSASVRSEHIRRPSIYRHHVYLTPDPSPHLLYIAIINVPFLKLFTFSSTTQTAYHRGDTSNSSHYVYYSGPVVSDNKMPYH